MKFLSEVVRTMSSLFKAAAPSLHIVMNGPFLPLAISRSSIKTANSPQILGELFERLFKTPLSVLTPETFQSLASSIINDLRIIDLHTWSRTFALI